MCLLSVLRLWFGDERLVSTVLAVVDLRDLDLALRLLMFENEGFAVDEIEICFLLLLLAVVVVCVL
jgi:hypothetical protein